MPRVSIFNRRHFGKPVPAGMRCPIITFSLNPLSSSTFPMVAALVKTLVVSWNDAAEIKLSVSNDAFVIPSKIGSPSAGLPPFPKYPHLNP